MSRNFCVYTQTTGNDVGSRSAYDGSVPYSVVANVSGTATVTTTDPFLYTICGPTGPEVNPMGGLNTRMLLSSDCTISTHDCWVEVSSLVSNATEDVRFEYRIYVGTATSSYADQRILYEYLGYIPRDLHNSGNGYIRLSIPDMVGIDAPEGTNIFCLVNVLAPDTFIGLKWNGHFCCNIDSHPVEEVPGPV